LYIMLCGRILKNQERRMTTSADIFLVMIVKSISLQSSLTLYFSGIAPIVLCEEKETLRLMKVFSV
jgi:hypothetical protein